MDRRFQTVFIYEPNDDLVYHILDKLRPIYEKYHGVKINDKELKLIVKLSNKYIYDRKRKPFFQLYRFFECLFFLVSLLYH